MGDYDVIKLVLGRMADMNWWQVAIRPAKPLAFGMLSGGVPIFGLPGNPVSSHVSYELFARPALLQMMGQRRRFRPVTPAVAAHDMRRRSDGKLHLDRVTLQRDEAGRLRAASAGGQASNVLSAMAASDGLVLLPDGEGAAAGESVDVLRLDLPADH
jgi:molybdopterin biosynthesis enzyme